MKENKHFVDLLAEAAARMADVARQLDSLALKLASKGRPGRVDYIDKTLASITAGNLAEELRK